MPQIAQRIQAMCSVVNIYRLLRLLVARFPDMAQLAVGDVMNRPCGAAIVINADSVTKHISNFSIQPNINNSFEQLVEVSCDVT